MAPSLCGVSASSIVPSWLESTKYGPPTPTKALTSEAPMVITLTCLVTVPPVGLPLAMRTVCGVPLWLKANWPDRCRKSATDSEM